jgi:hypothetical protein
MRLKPVARRESRLKENSDWISDYLFRIFGAANNRVNVLQWIWDFRRRVAVAVRELQERERVGRLDQRRHILMCERINERQPPLSWVDSSQVSNGGGKSV